jgi:hypothetical protein
MEKSVQTLLESVVVIYPVTVRFLLPLVVVQMWSRINCPRVEYSFMAKPVCYLLGHLMLNTTFFYIFYIKALISVIIIIVEN